MGFKRTTDGRVFFTGSNDSANDEPAAHKKQSDEQNKQRGGQPQLQVLSLLKSLNERLKSTQAERDYMRKQLAEYRHLIEGLEEKAEQNEEAYKSLSKAMKTSGGKSPAGESQDTEEFIRDTLREMEKTRRMILTLESRSERAEQTVSNLKKSQQVQAQKLARTGSEFNKFTHRLASQEEKQELLNQRIEDALTRQEKLTKKIDQTIEERERFMRKIERIEETVLQTRDALNARALMLSGDDSVKQDDPALGQALLLHDDGTVVKQAGPDLDENAKKGIFTKFKSNLKKGSSLNPLGALMPGLFFLAMAVGVYIGTTQPPKDLILEENVSVMPDASSSVQDWLVDQDTAAFSADVAEQASEADMAVAVIPEPPSAIEDIAIEPSEDIMIETPDETLPASVTEQGIQSQEEMVEMFEEQPEVLGQKMNAIEPGEPEVAAATQETAPEVNVAPAAPETAPQEPAIQDETFGADPNLPESIKAVEIQAMAGSPEAQHDLGAIYVAGHAGVEKDFERAVYWFSKAADQGIANASYNLGVLHHQGLGVQPDLEEAIYWYKQAAELGHAEAHYNLGIAYIEGIGVPYKPSQAAEYFEDAANKGVIEAAYNLGLIYENGLLGSPDPQEALLWYKTAADQGSPEARTALELLAKAIDVPIDDVNRIVDDVKAQKIGQEAAQTASDTPTAITPASKDTLKPSEPPQTYSRLDKISPPVLDNAQARPDASAPANAQNTEPASEEETLAAVEKEFEQILVSQVQKQLMRLGLYPGPADGIDGPLTSDAIRAYQVNHDLDITGDVSASLLEHMVEAAAGNN